MPWYQGLSLARVAPMTVPSLASNYAFSVFGFIGFVLVSILLPMHLRARNAGTCMYIVWTSIVCLTTAVNSIIWNRNYVNWSPVWCDISSRVIMAAGWGNEVALLCIIRRLYRIITMKAVNQSVREARRDLIVDLCIGIGLPILILSLQYIVEFCDFEIFEDVGCFPAVNITAPSIPIFVMWPAVFALVTAIYAGLTIYATIKRKAYRREIMSSNQALQFGHYWRLLTLTGIGIVCTLPYGMLEFFVNVLPPYQPYNWDIEHTGFSEGQETPASLWANDAVSVYSMEINRWSPLFNALVFFAFFGFTKEARQDYRRVWLFIIQPISIRSPGTNVLTARKTSLPTHHALRNRVNPETFGGSLRFMPPASSSQMMASTAQSSRFRPLSLPSMPSLSARELWSSRVRDVNGGSFSVSQSKGATEQTLDQNVLTMGWCASSSVPAVTIPAPVLEASAVLRRHTLDSTRPTAIQALQLPTSSSGGGVQ
ncbi:hypothetical protein SERLA73DRAFT_192129 [Serpula lacrymans var. lacrymans S7.3]|uniref:Uncharacterized protein n=2 Tax=Serpula lacrymans var. lacrymans TaxID=341189 RepID=F8QJ19_SERL3|nr:uncharacterized protein SERLADRAFT_478566 [Serpula lacrymans var. lacrymans S7.9]EGN91696.1 hypothetical protein SERLA73DRAFT_192129 [Serpula lacrymans var. lacrymans S7.3]EGO19986.1 hypothetical protein SERLADRAFT_478566 [Serpula lacrymans var. lacrymans S7.9]